MIKTKKDSFQSKLIKNIKVFPKEVRLDLGLEGVLRFVIACNPRPVQVFQQDEKSVYGKLIWWWCAG